MAGPGPARALDPGLLTTWRGVAYCYVPADEPVRLDRLISADGSDDRWNRPGEPTVYLALDIPTAVAEFARRVDLAAETPVCRRRLVGLSVEVAGLADLRNRRVRAALAVPEESATFRDRELARDVSSALRDIDHCGGLLVPSMAFLDDERRGNLVVFMDRGVSIEELVRGTADAGVVELRQPDGGNREVEDDARRPDDDATHDGGRNARTGVWEPATRR